MAIWENKDGEPDWPFIVLMCCLVPQYGDGGRGTSNLPIEFEWQRITDEEKAKAIADEIRRTGN